MSGVDLLSEIRRRFPQIVTIAMSGAYENVNELPQKCWRPAFTLNVNHPGRFAELYLSSLREFERRAHETFTSAQDDKDTACEEHPCNNNEEGLKSASRSFVDPIWA